MRVRRPDGFGPSYGTSWSGYVKIGNSQLNIPSNTSYSINTEWVDFITLSGVTVAHNADGSGSVVISGSVTGPSGTSIASTTSSGSATVTLERIPRGFSSTPTITPQSIEERKYNLYWTTSETCSKIVLKIGGVVYNTYNVNGTSGTIQITGAAANSTYTVGATFTRKDSGIDSNEITTTVKTVAYPSLNSVNPSTIKIGEGQTISLNNPLGRTITVYMKQNSTSGQTLKQISTSSKTSVPIQATSSDLYASIPNSKEGTAVYYCTYNDGSTTHTSSTLTGKYKIKDDETENPTFSNNFTYEDTNATTLALTGSNQIIVKDYSTVQVTIPSSAKAEAKNSATMQKYQFGSEIKDYSASADVVFTAKTVSTNSLSVTAIDSRQLPTSATKPINNWKAYSKPQITSATYERANNGSGTATTLRFSGTFWNDNFGATTNALTATYGWKVSSSSASAPDWGEEWTDHDIASTDISINGNNFSGTVAMQGDLNAAGFSINQNFDIRVRVYDKLVGREITFNLTSATPAIAIYKSNVAIGQKYNTTTGGKLQVNGATTINGREYINGATGTDIGTEYTNSTNNVQMLCGIGSGGENHGLYSRVLNKWIAYADDTYLYAGGYKFDLSTNNTTDTWVPVISNGALQHRVINAALNNKGVYTLSNVGTSGWTNQADGDAYLLTKAFAAFWNGAYSGSASNLRYCREGSIQIQRATAQIAYKRQTVTNSAAWGSVNLSSNDSTMVLGSGLVIDGNAIKVNNNKIKKVKVTASVQGFKANKVGDAGFRITCGTAAVDILYKGISNTSSWEMGSSMSCLFDVSQNTLIRVVAWAGNASTQIEHLGTKLIVEDITHY